MHRFFNIVNIGKLSENKVHEVMGGNAFLFLDQDDVVVLSDDEPCSRSLSDSKPFSLVSP